MKIMFVSPTVNLNGGGISSYAQDFVRIFKSYFDIIVVSADELVDGVICENQYRKVDLNNLSESNALFFLNLIKKEDPEVLINSGSTLLATIIQFIPTKINIISISHFVNGILADIAGFNGRYINNLVALSTYGKEYLYRWAMKDKIAVVPNFYEDERGMKMILNIISETPVIVYPGGCASHKNPLFVLRLVKLLLKTNLSFKFYWLGNDTLPLAFTFKEKRIRKNFEYDDRLVFTGKIDRDEAVNIISKATIFLLPSIGEGFPISLLEAMSFGTIPVISNAKHGSLDIIRNNYNGFIVDSNKIDVAFTLIKKIILAPNEYNCIKLNSYNVFHNEYSCEIWRNRMENLIYSTSCIKRSKKFSSLSYLLQKYFFMIFYIKNRFLMIMRNLCLCIKFHFFLR